MHMMREWRRKYPIKAAFKGLRERAKRRNKPFDVELWEFEALCAVSNYVDETGNKAFSLTIDRIDAKLGYTISNLQVVTRVRNSHKRNHEDYAHPLQPIPT